MEYGRREPIKGVPSQEPTAFTKKTIKELLAEESAGLQEMQLMRAPKSEPEDAPEVAVEPAAEPKVQPKRVTPAESEAQPRSALQQPPHMRSAFVEVAPPEETDTPPVTKPRSFLKRLIGG